MNSIKLIVLWKSVNQNFLRLGCGDAYRAGLVYGIMKNMSLEAIGELSSALGALKVQSFGTQNHTINNDIKKLL